MRSKLISLVALLVALDASVMPVAAQQACPCVPITKLWVASQCDTWNCASAALILANGDHSTFAVPFAGDATEQRWIVVRQVASGSYVDTTSPVQVDSFDSMAEASARYGTLGVDSKPMLATAPDGKVLVLSLRTPEKHRAVTQ
jgi:hypothetical protein